MLSLYIHIPFCVKRCSYCDFITYAGMNYLIEDYVSALIKEIQFIGNNLITDQVIGSIYFGGGTPSFLPVGLYKFIFDELLRFISINAKDCEITFEVNPGTVDHPYLKSLFNLGINRLSIGGQSFVEQDLKTLGRIHSVEDIFRTYNSARKTGFNNINLDLMFGLPHQNLASWQYNLNQVIKLSPEHLSLYNLTLEQGTQLFNRVESREISVPDEDENADMYEFAIRYLSSNGFIQYEISNWSKYGKFQSLHNKQYWENEPYIGIGVGAHSYFKNFRTQNTISIQDYINKMSDIKSSFHQQFSPACISSSHVIDFIAMQDTMMLGLRMTHDGITEGRFLKKHQKKLSDVFGDQITDLVNKDLLKWFEVNTGRGVRLTHRGIMLGNQVFMQFVGD